MLINAAPHLKFNFSVCFLNMILIWGIRRQFANLQFADRLRNNRTHMCAQNSRLTWKESRHNADFSFLASTKFQSFSGLIMSISSCNFFIVLSQLPWRIHNTVKYQYFDSGYESFRRYLGACTTSYDPWSGFLQNLIYYQLQPNNFKYKHAHSRVYTFIFSVVVVHYQLRL